MWLNNGIPADICEREPELKDRGIYRRLNDGRFEFLSFCDPRITDWLSIYNVEFYQVLDALLPAR